MNQLMVDLETLDTKPSAVVLSVGAVVFSSEKGISSPLYRRCGWQRQIDRGRTVSESTIRWWFAQSDDARAALAGDVVELEFCWESIRALYHDYTCERVWANGSTFDISILENAFPSSIPWKYNAVRDMRTLRDFLPPNFGDDIPSGTAHNALDDAMRQAEYVLAAFDYLKVPRS